MIQICFLTLAFHDQWFTLLVSDNPHLRALRVDMRKVKACLTVVSCFNLILLAVAVFNCLSTVSSTRRGPILCIVSTATFNLMTSFSITGCYMLIISLQVVIPLLRQTAEVFERAVREIDVSELRVSILARIRELLAEFKVQSECEIRRNLWRTSQHIVLTFQSAIACHGICCRLIAKIDRIGSYFFGAVVLYGVPVVAVMISRLGHLQDKEMDFSLGASAVVTLMYFVLMTLLIFVASTVHCEVQSRVALLKTFRPRGF